MTSQTGLRERKKHKTASTIRSKALQLFSTKGYSKTRIEDIASAAEVSVPTVLRYFSTKDRIALHDAYKDLEWLKEELETSKEPVIAVWKRFHNMQRQEMRDDAERLEWFRICQENQSLSGVYPLLAEVEAAFHVAFLREESNTVTGRVRAGVLAAFMASMTIPVARLWYESGGSLEILDRAWNIMVTMVEAVQRDKKNTIAGGTAALRTAAKSKRHAASGSNGPGAAS